VWATIRLRLKDNMGAWEVYTTALECPTAFLCIEKFRLACEEKATGGSFSSYLP
jgi:hypothetical protein